MNARPFYHRTNVTPPSPPHQMRKSAVRDDEWHTILLLINVIDMEKGYKSAPYSWMKNLKQNRLVSLLPSIALGSVIWFGVEPTSELTTTAIRLLAVFTRYRKIVCKYGFI